MGCWTCGNVCALISQQCFCKYQPDDYKLEGNEYAIMMANIELKGCIGCCIDKLCNPEDVSMDEVLETDEFKMFYAALIRYHIFCESGSRGKKAGDVKFKGDSQWDAVDYATFASKKKRLLCNIDDLKKPFVEWFEKQGYPCAEKKKKKNSCGCVNPCECSSNKNSDNFMVRL